MKKAEKNIIDIIPLTRIPLSRGQSFSYLAHEKLDKGTLVSIPLFKRKVGGIVIGNRPDFLRLGNIELKNIDSVIEENFLDEKQIELSQFVSDYYLSPLGIVLKFFVPKRVKARNKQQSATYNQRSENNIILTNEQQRAVDEITKKTKNYKLKAESYYLFGPAGSGKTEVYIHLILELVKKDPALQFLILLPEIMLTPQAVERYGAYFKSDGVVVLNSKISKGQFYYSWKKIKSGEAKIVIGSRMAVFAPFKKLGLIAVDEEQDISYKQWDMNPRYDARMVAEKLAEIHKAKIIFGSATPSIELFYKTKNRELKLLTLPQLVVPESPRNNFGLPEMVVVDMRKERWVKNFSPISKKLQSEISYVLKHGFQAILFINRQGMSNFSICADCRTVLKCPKCDRALVYDTKGHYECLHCSFKTSITPQCSKCKGLRFMNIGLGTQKIEREINELFPQARVARADNQSMKAPGSQEKIYQEFSAGKIDILIGTQMISKGWDLENVALVGIIDTDNMLSIPDFSSQVRAYQNIVQVSGRTGRPAAKQRGIVVIQSFAPESEIMQVIAEKNFEKLYEIETKERKNLNFPPFARLVKVAFQDYNLKRVDLEMNRFYKILSEAKEEKIKFSEPHEPFVPKVRGRFRKQIIIKLLRKDMAMPAQLRKVLNLLPAGWMIDVDPISII